MKMQEIVSGDTSDVHERMTPKTCRAARVLAEMEQIELAERAGVNVQTVRRYEASAHEPTLKTWRALKRVLETAGVMFIDDDENGGPGVRLRKPAASASTTPPASTATATLAKKTPQRRA